jgi:SAM-dependent methyltransferase
MSSYLGRHADFYDLFYANKDYEGEARFVHELILTHGRTAGTRMLELACGTGAHAGVFNRLGYQVIACDYSQDMIRVARAKLARAGASVELRHSDMRSLDADLQGFDVAVCLFDSIGYVRTNAAVLDVLAGVRKCLLPDGLFIFEFWHAPPMLRAFDPVRVRTWDLPDAQIMRVSNTSLNAAEQTASVAYDIIELRTDGTYQRTRETQENRFFLLQEMAALLLQGGFQLLGAHSGYSSSTAIDESTWHVVAVARPLIVKA